MVIEGALEVIEEKNSKKVQNNEPISKEEAEIKEAIQEGALEAIEEVTKSKKEASKEEGKKLSRKAKKTKKKEVETKVNNTDIITDLHVAHADLISFFAENKKG